MPNKNSNRIQKIYCSTCTSLWQPWLTYIHIGKSTEKSPMFLDGYRFTAAIVAYSLARVMRCVGDLHSPAPLCYTSCLMETLPLA